MVAADGVPLSKTGSSDPIRNRFGFTRSFLSATWPTVVATAAESFAAFPSSTIPATVALLVTFPSAPALASTWTTALLPFLMVPSGQAMFWDVAQVPEGGTTFTGWSVAGSASWRTTPYASDGPPFATVSV